ncbi:MAG: hypothetical protein LBK53_05120 [Heliobacteriaceae bacterium]|nr:hypothetical protein [Heliobacteriaceae bacterium]
MKKQIYQDFSKTQKSALCNFLRALVKKSPGNALERFVEDEKYYLEQGSSRFGFLADVIDDERFLKDTALFINGCKKFYEYKKSQEPLIQAQKAYEKQKRQFLKELKMKSEAPTGKQLKYYGSLCKKYNIVKMSEEEMTKFSLKEEISRILNEYTGNS